MTWTDNGHKINRRQYCPQCQHPIHLCICNDEPYKMERRQHKRRSLKEKLLR